MAPSALDLQLGALEIGLGICCFLVGIVTLQTLNYFRNFGRDPWTIKLLVATVYTFDLIHSAFLLHTLYVYSVTNFGNAERMEFSVWSLNTSIIFQGLVILLVQGFFCLRIFRISKSWILTFICLPLCLTRFAMSMTIVSIDFKFYSFAVVEIRFQTFVAATLAITAINDVAIASCVVGSLLKQKTGFSSTNKLIDKIIGFVVGTGLLTSVLAVVDLITFVTMKNYIWLGILIIIVKVYTNSLLASLNERSAARTQTMSFSASLTSTLPETRRNQRTARNDPTFDFAPSKTSTYELTSAVETVKGREFGPGTSSYHFSDHAV